VSTKPWWLQPWAVLDTETTGLNPEGGDRVVELGVVLFDNGEVVDRWGVLINPEIELPAVTTRITGIKPEDLTGAPVFSAVTDHFLSLLEGRLLVAYNVAFDRRFLLHELARVGRTLPLDARWLDPLVFAKRLQKGQGKMKLGIVAKRLGIPLEEAHRATADAECAGWVLKALAEEANLPADLDEILNLHEQWQAEQDAASAGWRSRRSNQNISSDTSGPRNALGPGYPFSDELDPIRYMFLRGTGRA
jgi:DNA polymerase III subunit epsilon